MKQFYDLLSLIDTGSERVAQPDVDAYNAGYSTCASEALRHIGQLDHVSLSTRQRLMDGLSAHLQRRDDVTTSMTSPGIRDVSGVPRRRLFDDEPRRSRRCRRPLADIQPFVSRDLPTVCRSKPSVAATDCPRFPFPVDVGHVTSTEVVTAQSAAGSCEQSGSRWLTADDGKMEPMWRPW